MQAAPDPDIFDGRTEASKQGSASAQSKPSQASNGGKTGSLEGASSDKINEILDSLDRMGGMTQPGKVLRQIAQKQDRPAERAGA